MLIRKYSEKDKEAVRKICLENADLKSKDSKVAKYILLMFCDYYIECEPDNCFVAVNDEDIPVGYIYGASDYDKYETVFMADYFSRIKSLSLRRAAEAKIEMHDHAIYKDEYPSHFHIDILENCRGGGIGSRLIEEFSSNVRRKGSVGVMMICGKDNILAQKFYKKNGLEILHTKKTGVAMGKKL